MSKSPSKANSKKTSARKTTSKTKAVNNTKKTANKKQAKGLGILSKAGLLFLIAGIIAGAIEFGLVWHRQHSAAATVPISQVLNSSSQNDNSGPLVSGTPVHITIPSVNIDLQVIPGYYYPATNSWTLSNDKAQYGVMTAKSNNKEGATFIYAHALDNVFGRLPKILPGQQAIVTTDNGLKFTYSFQQSTVTKPTDTSLFNYKGKPVLILQTCTGAWYQDRQLFVFNLTEIS